jgi:hypothetical protein
MLREHRPGVTVVKPTFIDGGPDTQTIPNFDFMSPHMIAISSVMARHDSELAYGEPGR